MHPSSHLETGHRSPAETSPVYSRAHAYAELTKIRISVMVLLTFVVAAILATHVANEPVSLSVLVWGVVGMALVAASGNATNMYIERYTDFLMPRTAHRPLPTARLSATEVASFAAVTIGVGTAILLYMLNWQTALCGIANWILYSFIYTPLKRKHWSNTEVGAVAGAMPILMGSLATTASISPLIWSFFGVLFLWQFPHFMAIAWKYRDHYRAGGMKMLTVTEPSGLAAGKKSVVTAVLLIVVSLIPMMFTRGWIQAAILFVPALILGWYYLVASWKFYQSRNEETARTLMLVSLVYLPVYMVALVVSVVV